MAEPGEPRLAGSEDRPPVQFGLLGPLTVAVGGRPVDLPGSRVRAVLALLLIQANHVVSADRLIDDLWAGEPTPGATATLQGYVSELRKALAAALGGPAPVVTRKPGYLVTVAADQLDVLRFEALVDEARTAIREGDGGGRVGAVLRRALAEWRGPALADFTDEPFARPVAARWEETRLWALEERVDAELATGGHNQLVTELAHVVEEHPLRERLWGQWMLALYRCGRQAEALRAYQELRRRLGDELAIDPSPALKRLEQAILVQDPALELATAAGPAPVDDPRGEPVAPKLPVQLTRFVGRERELAQARHLLATGRLVTLAGGGGSGKTRLALQLAAEAAGSYVDGVRFVDLSRVTEPSQVPAALATALGLEAQGASTADLAAGIGDAEILLLVDNCEHVVEAAAGLVHEVLSSCPGATILATSQEELGIWGEAVLRVPSLSLPRLPQQATTEDLLASEAVQLFLDRAAATDPGLAGDPAALQSVAKICRRLDGIPLALELAAALVSVLALDEIEHRLDDRFDLLTRGSRHAVPRQRTLRAAIDWSYELLQDSERALFQRLAVFVGDFSVEAAAAVAGSGPAFVDDLAALVAKSMVAANPGAGGDRRYRLLDSLRQYGLEKLHAAGDEAQARRRHAVHYMEFAVAVDRRLHSHDATDGSARLVEELSNLRAALEWCFSGGDLEIGVELAGALRWWFFGRFGQLDRARGWLEDAVARRQELPPALQLKALVAVMTVAFSQGDYAGASGRGEEAVALAQELDDHRELAVALMARGGAAVFEGKLDRAVECLERSLAYCDELGDRWGRAWVLTFWGMASRRAGDHELARAQLDEALSIFRAARDALNQVIPLAQLALVSQQAGDLDDAARYCQEAIALARRLGDRELAQGSLCVYGLVQLARGRRDEARQLFLSTLGSGRGMENQLVVALALEGLAIVAHQEGRDAEGILLWGYTARLRSELGTPLTENRRAERDRHLAVSRSRLGDDEVERLLDAGRGLTTQEVLGRVGGAPAVGIRLA